MIRKNEFINVLCDTDEERISIISEYERLGFKLVKLERLPIYKKDGTISFNGYYASMAKQPFLDEIRKAWESVE